ncbi:PREDICTED: uncharacterized protein LOC102019163 [Chinchilla lanigera]|uniref:uncharacterized protein LOC102019163 n=1 Tax=Chinchilla lanigera TaxID=34839 RepID=UPI00038EC88A|nr:PREDICTED: uncharacterized protein LOC102019163 [Chinchilla lanigera]
METPSSRRRGAARRGRAQAHTAPGARETFFVRSLSWGRTPGFYSLSHYWSAYSQALHCHCVTAKRSSSMNGPAPTAAGFSVEPAHTLQQPWAGAARTLRGSPTAGTPLQLGSPQLLTAPDPRLKLPTPTAPLQPGGRQGWPPRRPPGGQSLVVPSNSTLMYVNLSRDLNGLTSPFFNLSSALSQKKSNESNPQKTILEANSTCSSLNSLRNFFSLTVRD